MKSFINGILKNRVPIFFIIFSILLISSYNVFSISQSVFPKVAFPQIKIKIDRGFVPLKQMQMQVTKPLEDRLYSISGIKRITSKTYQGVVKLSLTFDWNTNLNQAYQSTLTKVSEITSTLPLNSKIKIVKMSTSAFAVEGYSLYSDTVPINKLKEYVANIIRPSLEKLNGVRKVEIIGGADKEYKVVLKPNKLIQYGLSPTMVSQIIKNSNDIKFVGAINQEYKMYLGVSDYQLKNIKNIENIVLKNLGERAIYLKDIAAIKLKTTSNNIITSTNGHPAILFNILKHQNANVLLVSKDVKNKLQILKSKLPKDVHISKWYDLSEFVQKSINGVIYNLLMGMVLVSLVVVLFLRNFKMSFSLLIFIPITMIISVAIMKYFGMTLNIMSLGGLTAALGILVDNASVVVENIQRHFNKEKDINSAVISGTSEVVNPLIFATLTTIAVFIPLLMLDGIAGFFFKSTSMTIVITLSISLFLAIFFIPILMKYFFRNKKFISYKKENLTILQKTYKSFLNNALKIPIVIIILSLAMGGYSVYLFKSLPTSFLPTWDEGTFVMDLDMPPGTSLKEMSRVIKGVEEVIKNTPIIKTYSSQIGDAAVRPNEAHFFMHPKIQTSKNALSTFDIMDNLEQKLISRYPELNVDLHQILPDRFIDFSGKQKAVIVQLSSLNQSDLLSSYKKIKADLEKFPFIKKIKAKVPEDAPLFDISYKKEILKQKNLNEKYISNQIKIALQGSIVTQIYQGTKTIGLRVIYPLEYKKYIEKLKNLPIFTQNGKYIPLGNLANIKIKMKPRSAYSQNGMQIINMEIKTDSKDLKKNVKMIESKLNKLKLPRNVNVELAGDWKNQQKSFKQLLYIVAFAAFLIFILLLWQFKKYTVAFIVFLGAILSLSFVVYGLFITKTSFNVSAFIGLIISLGIVVNNGILVVSFIEDIKDKSSTIKNAIIEASMLRVRAIMITSITTIGGFLPMAMKLGYGGEMLQPLAIAIIFGLIGSIFISLIIIPSFYLFFVRK